MPERRLERAIPGTQSLSGEIEEHLSSEAKNLPSGQSPDKVLGDPYLFKIKMLLGKSPFEPFLPLVWGMGKKAAHQGKVGLVWWMQTPS